MWEKLILKQIKCMKRHWHIIIRKFFVDFTVNITCSDT